MSYDIIYDKQFVRAKDKFLPIILIGSNNCFEVGSRNRDGRRSRNWYCDTYICNNKMFATREEIMTRVEEIRQNLIDRNIERNKKNIEEGHSEWNDNYSDDSFGYYSGIAIGGASTRNTTFSKFKSLYKTGMDKALTIEQLAEEGVFVEINTYSYNDEAIKKAKELEIEYLGNVIIKTTDELFEQIEKFETTYKNNIHWYISFTNEGEYFEKKISRIRQKHFPKVKKSYEYKEFDCFYTIIEPKHNGYFSKFTKYGYKYSPYSPQYTFKTLKEAQTFVKKHEKRLNLMIQKIDRKITLKTLKDHE